MQQHRQPRGEVVREPEVAQLRVDHALALQKAAQAQQIQLILHEQTRTCQAHTYMHMPYLTQNTHSRALTHTAHDTRTEIRLCATGVSARVVSQGKQALTSLVKYLRMVAAPA